MQTQARNRKRQASSEPVAAQIDDHLVQLGQQASQLDQDIAALLQRHPVWQAKAKLLRSIPSVGPVLVAILLAQLPELGHASIRKSPPWPGSPLQPGQWTLAGQANRPGRTKATPGGAVPGDAGGYSVQSGHSRLLPASAGRGQSQEGGARRVHAQTARLLQRHHQIQHPLEGPNRPLTTISGLWAWSWNAPASTSVEKLSSLSTAGG